jgi:hypothetical protein
MDYFMVFIVALPASDLSLFSGFGLATLLLPVFAIFSPGEMVFKVYIGSAARSMRLAA